MHTQKKSDCLNILVRGIVQGVGFRPFVYNLARELSLRGFVTNSSEGVRITVEGDALATFIERVRTDAPPLSRITSIDISPAEPSDFTDFFIKSSNESGSFTLVSPDIAICQDCSRELFDPDDRRYLYPFINCTNCGPRYTITRSVPYDRINTTMNVFTMCAECKAEYDSPSNRRFHAQPNACPKCGPKVFLYDSTGAEVKSSDPVGTAVDLLKKGHIVAVKGLGGFHLACDASNTDAVRELRKRKRKSNKPFALMSPDVASANKFCHISEDESRLLSSPRRPVVLLRKREGVLLPEAIAPRNSYLGFMLPYTPLHVLLFFAAGREEADFSALVMTSGNLSEEPIIIENEEALSRLSGLADYFLMHDRSIFMRVDDSVVKASDESSSHDHGRTLPSGTPAIFFVRRSRGYAPDPIPLHDSGPEVLGCGADIKNTFTLTKGDYAIPSQHIGDMENYETLRFFEETLENLKSVYRVEPDALAYDLHPRYVSTQWALHQGGRGFRGTMVGIQHHYAHIASVMAEHGILEKVIGVSFDGSGFGGDGTVWGGEFLISDIAGFTRAGHIRYVPLPGGEKAVREPWRMGISYLYDAAGDYLWDYLKASAFMDRFDKDLIDRIIRISGMREFSPLSSGAGRLFDAVASLIGICDFNTYEGEAAVTLHSIADETVAEEYPCDVIFRDPIEIDFSHAILRMMEEKIKEIDNGVLAAKFHHTMASAIIKVVLKLSLVTNLNKVVLTGGVFQNSLLKTRVRNGLVASSLDVYLNEQVPCNDAGISLGQAYIVRERIKKGIISCKK